VEVTPSPSDILVVLF